MSLLRKSASLFKCLPLLAALGFSVAKAQPATTCPVAVPAEADGCFAGRVIETMSTAGYTYLQVDTGSQKIWAATTGCTLANGELVAVTGGIPMVNFHSKTLNRDFAVIYFTGNVAVQSAGAKCEAPALPPGHPALTGQSMAGCPMINQAKIKKAEGGMTLQEIFAGRSKLAGQPVTVRGRVVKYNARILGKNWLHIQDGSGSAGEHDNDLAVTTDTAAKVGDTVLVVGKVSTDRDFGAGYKFPVILENASVKVE